MAFYKEIRAAVFGLGGQQIEEHYGPIARLAYENGRIGRTAQGRYPAGGAMYAFATEGLRQYNLDKNVARRVECIKTRREQDGMAC